MADRRERGEVAGVVLAAGEGRRLRPLTGLLPKVLCPVAGRPLVDHALDAVEAALSPGRDHVAVNAHHGAARVANHVDGRAHISFEPGEALGTAGALGALRGWLDGRGALVRNGDAWFPPDVDLTALLAGWDGERPRLLVTPAQPGLADFDGFRFVGASLLPWAGIRELRPEPTGLYEVWWAEAHRRGGLELVHVPGAERVVDCGTPSDYLLANLAASAASGGTDAVVGERAVVGAGAHLERCVVWPGARVAPGERLVEAVRAWGDVTVDAPLSGASTPPSRRPPLSPPATRP